MTDFYICSFYIFFIWSTVGNHILNNSRESQLLQIAGNEIFDCILITIIKAGWFKSFCCVWIRYILTKYPRRLAHFNVTRSKWVAIIGINPFMVPSRNIKGEEGNYLEICLPCHPRATNYPRRMTHSATNYLHRMAYKNNVNYRAYASEIGTRWTVNCSCICPAAICVYRFYWMCSIKMAKYAACWL